LLQRAFFMHFHGEIGVVVADMHRCPRRRMRFSAVDAFRRTRGRRAGPLKAHLKFVGRLNFFIRRRPEKIEIKLFPKPSRNAVILGKSHLTE
jgi:hypothetical protein